MAISNTCPTRPRRLLPMEITKYIADSREALLVADYNAYRTQLSRRMLAIRKRLGLATNKREKFTRSEITAENIAQNHEYVHLILSAAERTWAHAMHIKAANSDDASRESVTGRARSHIISRLVKGANLAETLVKLLQDQQVSGSSSQDIVEVRAYQSTLAGAVHFETSIVHGSNESGQSSWQRCLKQYSTARIIYASLDHAKQLDRYRDFLSNTIDPTIRYAAYQARVARTIPVPVIAKRFFPADDKVLVALVEAIDPTALTEQTLDKPNDEQPVSDVQEIPSFITWRKRKANIVDASIGQAMAGVSATDKKLKTFFDQNPTTSAKDKAAAYDDVLTAAQDAADAVKAATGELEKERVDESDSRMQDLRIASLAINYDLISWRIGRNRVLIGTDDGITLSSSVDGHPRKRLQRNKVHGKKRSSGGRQIAHLRERVVLYDAIIQSIASVKELRGAIRDTSFMKELDDKIAYFRTLKCLNIAFSHGLRGHHLQALAILQRAVTLSSQISPDSSETGPAGVPKLTISTGHVDAVKQQVGKASLRARALVELSQDQNVASSSDSSQTLPVVRSLHNFTASQAASSPIHFVSYPPKLSPVPVKPLFLDVAWNYINYHSNKATKQGDLQVVEHTSEDGSNDSVDKPQEKKKGWFGFGR